MRKSILLTAAVTLFSVYAAVIAGEAGDVEKYRFMFQGNSGEVELELSSQTMGFGLHDLEPGDSRTTVTEDGSSITITRLAEVFTLDTGGEVFEIPARHPAPNRAEGHMCPNGSCSHHKIMMHGADGLTVVTREPLDENKRITIRDALTAAGITEDVKFLAPGAGGHKEIIEQEIVEDGEGQRRTIIKRVIAE